MPRTEVFRKDLEELAEIMGLAQELHGIIDRLVELHARGMVKINHSAMELVVAGYLVRRGYEEIEVEKRLSEALVCDVYGVKAGSSVIVEVETGFTPPSNALDPTNYIRARIASKISRYSHYASKMSIGVPPFYTPLIPRVLLRPPKTRREEEIKALKGLLDQYYHNPPISIDEIRNARLHTIMIVDVDKGSVKELDPMGYYADLCSLISYYSDRDQ